MTTKHCVQIINSNKNKMITLLVIIVRDICIDIWVGIISRYECIISKLIAAYFKSLKK